MKKDKQKKKLLIERIAILALLVLLAVVVVVDTVTNKPSVSLDAAQAQTVLDSTLADIAEPSAQTACALVQALTLTATDVAVGSEKDFALTCTYQTTDVYALYTAHKEELFADVYRYAQEEKAAGRMVNGTKLRQKADEELLALLPSAGKTSGEILLTAYEINASLAKEDVLAIPYEGTYLRVYLDNEAVDRLFGGLQRVKSDIESTKTVLVGGETVDISSMNTLRNGIKSSLALRNFSVYQPDSSAFFVSLWNTLVREFRFNFVEKNRWLYLAEGLLTTLEITLLSAVLGVVIGFICAIIRVTRDRTGGLMIGDQIVRLYLTVIRGTPAMVQLMIVYFVILLPVGIEKFPAAVMCFAINSGAYVAEIVRGGINSVDAGQVEAGRSLGFNYVQTMWHVVIPQAFKAVLPALANEFITLLKESSVAFYIGVADLTQGGLKIRSITYSNFMPLIAVALIYLVLVVILTRLVGVLERRLRKDERG